MWWLQASPWSGEAPLKHECGVASSRTVIDSLPSGSIQSESDGFLEVSGDEQTDLSCGQAVVSHFSLVG